MNERKWHKFYSTYSPIDIQTPNMGSANLAMDWFREGRQGSDSNSVARMFVNGEPLHIYAELYNQFRKTEDVEAFFKEVILGSMIGLDETRKNSTVNYLKTTFHQGGFMHPVSSAIATSMKEDGHTYASILAREIKPVIKINTNETGFSVEELVILPKLSILSDNFPANAELNDGVLLPEPGFDWVIKAQGRINIDLSKDLPFVAVESNNISYGHWAIKEKMDNRNFVQIIMDFLKKIFGVNQVEDITPDRSEEHEHEDNSSHIFAV